MNYRHRFIVSLLSIASFSQLSPTVAVNKECIDQIRRLPVTPGVDYSILKLLVLDQCEESVSDCNVDRSTNGRHEQNPLNRTTADIHRGLSIGALPSRSIDEGHVVGLLAHYHI